MHTYASMFTMQSPTTSPLMPKHPDSSPPPPQEPSARAGGFRLNLFNSRRRKLHFCHSLFLFDVPNGRRKALPVGKLGLGCDCCKLDHNRDGGRTPLTSKIYSERHRSQEQGYGGGSATLCTWATYVCATHRIPWVVLALRALLPSRTFLCCHLTLFWF
jgi:hypothetical protein